MSDAYRDLVETLRGAVVESDDGGETTRQRILHSLGAPPSKRRPRLVLGLVAAGLAVSTAFALYLAQPFTRDSAADNEMRIHRAELLSTQPPTDAARSGPRAPERVNESPDDTPASAPLTSAQPGDELVQDHPRIAAPVADARKGALRHRRAKREQGVAPAFADPHHAAAAAQPVSASAARSPTRSPADQTALYLTAHHLQFRGAPQRALEAWDAYLEDNPSGPLRREAEYNRAVVLMRLGRRAEARQALLPFARGEHSGFRKAEAQRLLDQLER